MDGAQAAAAQWAATFKDFPPVQKPHTFTLDRKPMRAEVSRSEEVRDFYERMPYPAPLTSLDGYRDLYKNPNRRRA